MKNSKVTSVQSNGTWEGKYGMMYKFEIGFENGDVGEYSSKNQEQNKFVIGTNAEYEYTDGKFPKVKPVYIKPESFNKSFNNSANDNPDRQKLIVRQSSLKAAVEYNSNCSSDEVLDNADKFYNWVMETNKTSDNFDSRLKNKIDEITDPNQYVSAFDAKFKGSTPDDLPF
tara:strand:- start:24 stop:536 length:513 start_codon:yes stop_codon:yes gene_type:complete